MVLPRPEGCRLLHRTSRHGALHADADLGAEVIKIEVLEVGDNSRGSTVIPEFFRRVVARG
jgi:hypothetical protein